MNEDPTKPDATNNDVSPEVVAPSGSGSSASAPLETSAPSLGGMPESPSSVEEPMPTTPASSAPATEEPALPLFQPDTPALSAPLAHVPKPKLMPMLICAVIGLVVAAAIAFGAYHFGNNHGYAKGKAAEAAAVTAAQLKVPAGATMIAQCAAGEGTQYVLPSNIPAGPIYNVWNGKVTGIEYMLAQSSIADSKTLNLALHSQKYNHVDVMYEPSGHAGFTEPHYHIVLSFISYADEQKITCGGSSSTMGM